MGEFVGLPPPDKKDWEDVREALLVLLAPGESVEEGEGEALGEKGEAPAAPAVGDGVGASVAEGVADPMGG